MNHIFCFVVKNDNAFQSVKGYNIFLLFIYYKNLKQYKITSESLIHYLYIM